MINLELTQDEAQIILNALVKEPYLQVYELIDNIQKQSSEQMKSQIDKNPFFAEPMEGQGNGI